MRARKENESFKNYKKVRKQENEMTKIILRTGRLLWNSNKNGTYIRAIHG